MRLLVSGHTQLLQVLVHRGLLRKVLLSFCIAELFRPHIVLLEQNGLCDVHMRDTTDERCHVLWTHGEATKAATIFQSLLERLVLLRHLLDKTGNFPQSAGLFDAIHLLDLQQVQCA